MAFAGIINRPLPISHRSFRLEQTHKVQEFQRKFIEYVEEHNIKDRIVKLAKDFQNEGKNERNVAWYNKLDKEIVRGAVAAAKKISRTDFGYICNPELVRCGQTVLAYKYMLDCAKRRASATPGLKK